MFPPQLGLRLITGEPEGKPREGMMFRVQGVVVEAIMSKGLGLKAQVLGRAEIQASPQNKTQE